MQDRSLFSLVQKFEQSELFNPETGEITYIIPTIEKEEFTREKIDRCVIYLRELESQNEGINNLIKEFAKNKQSLESKISRYKSYLMHCLKCSGEEKLQGNAYKIKKRKGAPSVFITAEEKIPAHYLIREVEIKIDKKQIAKDLKDGISVEGAELKIGDDSISISGGI